MKVSIIGGGAAGVFSALQIKERRPDAEVTIYERSQRLLAKVAISGGGRCNVTCDTKEPEWLIDHYPRGGKRLLGPLYHFPPEATIEWFLARGVSLKREEDGRYFPVTDSSETIIACFMKELMRTGVHIRKGSFLKTAEKMESGLFRHVFEEEGALQEEFSDALILATGSHASGYPIAKAFGHTIVETVPSLFAFNCPDSNLLELSGISLPFVKASLPEAGLIAYGPLLITHLGFSGPAILRLSAFGARWLHGVNYKAILEIDWSQGSESDIPKRLKKKLGEPLPEKSFYKIEGRTANKSEFVTAGGVTLSEIDYKTMESRLVKGLFFAGELLDVDGLTGGFNFQHCWMGGALIGAAFSEKN